MKVHGLHLCAHFSITTGETPRCNWGDQSLVKKKLFFFYSEERTYNKLQQCLILWYIGAWFQCFINSCWKRGAWITLFIFICAITKIWNLDCTEVVTPYTCASKVNCLSINVRHWVLGSHKWGYLGSYCPPRVIVKDSRKQLFTWTVGTKYAMMSVYALLAPL